ncbi:uncharacterized protein LOC142557023 [Dermacentor variabilis]|uniref:uncharacterized protein LOC142557023 n=1 Tax=Dermacentor variabilis TaxID=34621 RepID=UPI003F5AEC31
MASQTSLTLATLNVRGLASRKKQSQLYRLLMEEDLDVLAVQETKVEGEEETANMLRGFTTRYLAVVSHAIGRSAAALELRGGTDEDGVFSDFDSQELMSSVVDGNLEPLPAGSKHLVTISLPSRWGTAPRGDDSFYLTAYLAARVVNADGLKSERSNVVRVMFEIANITASLPRTVSDRVTIVTTSTCIKPAQDHATTPTAEVQNEREKDNLSVYIWILLLVVAAVIFMSISIMLLLKTRSNNFQENEATTMKTQTTTMKSSWLGPWQPWEK